MNQEMADKLGHYKREVSTLNKKLEAVTENKKLLEQTCIQQQSELNKLRSQLKRINEVTRE